jgi:ribosomal protein L3
MIGGSTRGKGTRCEVKQWGWKINHASKGVVVNVLDNGISWTSGHKERREQEASWRKIKPPVVPFAR